jgi:hypothetical protein
MLAKESDPLEDDFSQFHSSAFDVWKTLVPFTGISANKRVEEEKKSVFIFKLENPTASITERLRIQPIPLLETIS